MTEASQGISRRAFLKGAAALGATALGYEAFKLLPDLGPKKRQGNVTNLETIENKGPKAFDLSIYALALGGGLEGLSAASLKTIFDSTKAETFANGFRGLPIKDVKVLKDGVSTPASDMLLVKNSLDAKEASGNFAVMYDRVTNLWYKVSPDPKSDIRLIQGYKALTTGFEVSGVRQDMIDATQLVDLQIGGKTLKAYQIPHLGPSLHWLKASGSADIKEVGDIYAAAQDLALKMLSDYRYVRSDPNFGNIILAPGDGNKTVVTMIDWENKKLVLNKGGQGSIKDVIRATILPQFAKYATDEGIPWTSLSCDQAIAKMIDAKGEQAMVKFLSAPPMASQGAVAEVVGQNALGQVEVLEAITDQPVAPAANMVIDGIVTGSEAVPATTTEKLITWAAEEALPAAERTVGVVGNTLVAGFFVGSLLEGFDASKVEDIDLTGATFGKEAMINFMTKPNDLDELWGALEKVKDDKGKNLEFTSIDPETKPYTQEFEGLVKAGILTVNDIPSFSTNVKTEILLTSLDDGLRIKVDDHDTTTYLSATGSIEGKSQSVVAWRMVDNNILPMAVWSKDNDKWQCESLYDMPVYPNNGDVNGGRQIEYYNLRIDNSGTKIQFLRADTGK